MKVSDLLMEELKRLNRINDKLEEIENGYNEPERIVRNVKAMCEIAITLSEINSNQ